MTTVNALRAESQRIMADVRAIVNGPKPTTADLARADVMMAKSDEIVARVKAIEKVTAAETGIREGAKAINFEFGVTTAKLDSTFQDEIKLIRALARGDGNVVGSEMHADIRAEWNRRAAVPQAAGSTTTSSGGGYAIAPSFMAELLVAMKAQGGMRAASNTFTTTTGAPLTWPTEDDRLQSGRLLTSENVQLNGANDLLFGASAMGAYTFVSDVALVSVQLMQDSAFDFGALLVKALASRLARAENPYFTSGTGVNQPRGILTDAVAGVVAPTGNTISLVSADPLYDLVASVDPVYRVGACFMLNDASLQLIRKIKDSTGRYIHTAYLDPTRNGTPVDTILGYPVVINPDMPAMAANAKPVLFGSFDNYKVRTVVDLRLQVLRERYADVNQVGFIASIRSDGRLVSGASPIKYLQNSAT